MLLAFNYGATNNHTHVALGCEHDIILSSLDFRFPHMLPLLKPTVYTHDTGKHIKWNLKSNAMLLLIYLSVADNTYSAQCECGSLWEGVSCDNNVARDGIAVSGASSEPPLTGALNYI